MLESETLPSGSDYHQYQEESFSEAIRIRQLRRVSARNDVRAKTSTGEKTFKASRGAHLDS